MPQQQIRIIVDKINRQPITDSYNELVILSETNLELVELEENEEIVTATLTWE